jgi:histidinol-phosphatase (PHP family)
MKIDLHTHNSRCGHASGKIKDYIEFAISKNLSVIGISDHMPFFCSKEDRLMPRVAMAKSDFDEYINDVLMLQNEYKEKINVLLGLEADFSSEHIKEYDQIFRHYPFDYIICSVHRLNGIDIYNKKRWDSLSEKECYKDLESYYGLIAQLASSNYFEIIGHFDAIKTYCPIPLKNYLHIIERALKVIAEHDIVMEINTSGKIKEINEWFPADIIIEMAHSYGIKFTFSSDAHVPERVGEGFKDVVKLLKALGCKELATFEKRKRIMISI